MRRRIFKHTTTTTTTTIIEEDDTPPPPMLTGFVPYDELPRRHPRTLTQMPDGRVGWLTRRRAPEDAGVSRGRWYDPPQREELEATLPPLRGEIEVHWPQRRHLGA